jgi:hypothetical protein
MRVDHTGHVLWAAEVGRALSGPFWLSTLARSLSILPILLGLWRRDWRDAKTDAASSAPAVRASIVEFAADLAVAATW